MKLKTTLSISRPEEGEDGPITLFVMDQDSNTRIVTLKLDPKDITTLFTSGVAYDLDAEYNTSKLGLKEEIRHVELEIDAYNFLGRSDALRKAIMKWGELEGNFDQGWLVLGNETKWQGHRWGDGTYRIKATRYV